MPNTDYIVIRETGDAENDFEGGYLYTYYILLCNISEEKSELIFDVRSFGACPDFRSPEEQRLNPRKGYATRGPFARKIQDMDRIDDDIIDELRERDIKIFTIPMLPRTCPRAPILK